MFTIFVSVFAAWLLFLCFEQRKKIIHLREHIEFMKENHFDQVCAYENALSESLNRQLDIGKEFYEQTKDKAILPKTPDLELLKSMAIRSDVGLAIPGYYDQPMFSASGITHQQRYESTLLSMAQLYEEVVGEGFHKPKTSLDQLG